MTSPDRRATSLILTGAGSYAAYEVGVMSALFAGRRTTGVGKGSVKPWNVGLPRHSWQGCGQWG